MHRTTPDHLHLLGLADTARLTTDLTGEQQRLLDEFIAAHPADYPVHALALAAFTPDGGEADRAALNQLLQVTR